MGTIACYNQAFRASENDTCELCKAEHLHVSCNICTMSNFSLIYLFIHVFFLLLFDIKQPVRQNFTPQGHKMSQNTAPLQAPFHVKAVYVCFCMSLDSHGNL